MENDSDTRGRTQKPFGCWTCRQRTSSQVEMEIPMTTERKVKKILALPDRSHNRVAAECNGILSRRNVASRRSHDVVYFLSCHQCQLCVSRGTFDAAGIEGSRQQPEAAKHAVSHSGNCPTTEAETEHVKIPKSPSITKCRSCRAQLKRRRPLLLLPSAVLTFLLLTFVACRPCHGHDPVELKFMDDEDGKFSISLYL